MHGKFPNAVRQSASGLDEAEKQRQAESSNYPNETAAYPVLIGINAGMRAPANFTGIGYAEIGW